MVTKHKPVIRAPYYADEGDGTMIHRYLDEDFVNRHLLAMRQAQLQGNRAQNWRFEDRFTEDKTLPWLRLPIHRTFYMVSCEVVCNAFAHPAFNPQNITSAGFVVRRRDGSRWLQTSGVAQGWHFGHHKEADPDHVRQLRRQKLIRPRLPESLPSGEETYPLHAQLIDATSADGRQRKHTLLYGFLPLSGSVQNQIIENRSQINYFVDSLPWPFGCQDQDNNQAPVWQRGDGNLMQDGQPKQALIKLVNQLVSRYQLLDSKIAANKALNDFLKTVYFYCLPDVTRYQQIRQRLSQVVQQIEAVSDAFALLPAGDIHEKIQALAAKKSAASILPDPVFAEADDFAAERLTADTIQARQWLDAVLVLATKIRAQTASNPEMVALLSSISAADGSLRALQTYLSNIDNFKLQSLQSYLETNKDALLELASSDEDRADILLNLDADWHFFISEDQAMQLRRLLFDRSTAITQDYVDSLQIPRYQQNSDDIYYVKPFVRYLDDNGCEQIVWGVNSEPFRVAAPFDPEASRPQSIQLPKWSDLQRGLAKGATFLAPSDLAEKIKNVGMEMPPTKKTGDSLGMEWIISFSLPVVTICAMLLLMIVLNLLNFIFQWLPFAITLIPKPK